MAAVGDGTVYADSRLDMASSILDVASMMTDTSPDLNQRIAARVRALRTTQGISLELLASRCAVSRSMISLIERGESSPTAVVLEKLAAGLGVTLASLFDAPATSADGPPSPVSRREEQAEWQDPDSGYRRRNVSPPDMVQPVQIVDVHFPAGARVAFDIGLRDIRVSQQVWILEGAMEVTVGTDRHHLRDGDCFVMQLDRPILFHNPTRDAARYAVVLLTESTLRR